MKFSPMALEFGMAEGGQFRTVIDPEWPEVPEIKA